MFWVTINLNLTVIIIPPTAKVARSRDDDGLNRIHHSNLARLFPRDKVTPYRAFILCCCQTNVLVPTYLFVSSITRLRLTLWKNERKTCTCSIE